MRTRKKRFIILVLDGVGIGEMPDAGDFGDRGAHTLAHVLKVYPAHLPTLQSLGLGNIEPLPAIPPHPKPIGAFGKMAERSAGKDTSVGHWEIAGLITTHPLPVYPHGFPAPLLAEYEKLVGRKTIGNKPAAGTEIIQELGAEHCRTGDLIVYTSADSVFQVAAHEAIVPLEELYHDCQLARELLTGRHGVGRVIARPFVGTEATGFSRVNEHRRDFSLQPPGETVLDRLSSKGYDVIGIGKIEDIFGGRGITEAEHTKNNDNGMAVTNAYLAKDFEGLLFVNLVDTDMVYGHRNDCVGYGKALEALDKQLAETLKCLREDDILVVTADHGCDPGYPTTDHTREYVPLLVYGAGIKAGRNLGVRTTFADVAQSVAEYFELGGVPFGCSVLTT